jgi:hypothetical protein
MARHRRRRGADTQTLHANFARKNEATRGGCGPKVSSRPGEAHVSVALGSRRGWAAVQPRTTMAITAYLYFLELEEIFLSFVALDCILQILRQPENWTVPSV